MVLLLYLQVELLRGIVSDRNERPCLICKMNETENELHFILKCNNEKMTIARNNLFDNIKNYFNNNPFNSNISLIIFENDNNLLNFILLSARWNDIYRQHPQVINIILKGFHQLWICHQQILISSNLYVNNTKNKNNQQ